MESASFEWDEKKNRLNQVKHGIGFELAQYAFADPGRVIAEDLEHSGTEKRYLCFGKVGDKVVTARFTYRNKVIRIIGAGYWRKGKSIYEKAHSLQK